MKFPSLCAVLLLVALPACGGSSPAVIAGCPTPVPGSGTGPAPSQLLYPIPNATGVPDGNFSLVTFVATSVSLTAGATVIALGTPGPAPFPLPSPMASPYAGGGAMLQGEAAPALQTHTTYAVLDQRGAAGVCNPPLTLGSFTTQ